MPSAVADRVLPPPRIPVLLAGADGVLLPLRIPVLVAEADDVLRRNNQTLRLSPPSCSDLQ